MTHRVAAAVARQRLEVGGVAERHVVRRRGLAGDAAHGQRVAAVRGDGDVEHLVAQVEQVDRVRAELAASPAASTRMPVVVVAERRARGPSRSCRRRRGRRSCARRSRSRRAARAPGSATDDEVADGEVARAADDARAAPASPTSTWHQRIGFLKPVSSSTPSDPADDERAGRRRAPAGRRSRPRGRRRPAASASSRAVTSGGQVDVLPQPGQRDPHQTSIPNGRVKRTSPSTMSRMSSTPWRNIRVRSMPMPEGEAGVAVGVDAAGDQHPRVDHAAAAPLDPALGRAGAARRGPGCRPSRRGRRSTRRSISALGSVKGKYDGRSRVRMPSPNIACGEVVERALQVGHRDALVDDQALDLVEDRGVRGVELVGAVDPAGAHDVDRRLAARACVRICTGEVWVRSTTPESSRARRRRCPASARAGWSGGDVERVEVEPLRLDLGALGDLVAHGDEHVGDALRAWWSAGAGRRAGAVPGQRDVDGLLDEDPLVALGLELGLAGVERLGDGAAGGARPACRPRPWRPGGRAPISRLASASGDRSPACARRTCLERVEVGGRGDGGQRLVAGRSTSSAFKRGRPRPGRRTCSVRT